MKLRALILCFLLASTLHVFAQCPDGFNASGTNRAVNGSFDDGNSGFTSEYIYVADNPSVQNELNPEGRYSVWHNPNHLHSNFSACTDPDGLGLFMIVNGSPTVDMIVWSQTITVEENTLYYFVTDVTSVHPDNPAELQFSVNGDLLGDIFTASSTTCVWDQFYATWFSGAHTSATISIVNKNTIAAGNDFALNNIAFVPCEFFTPIELVYVDANQHDNSAEITWLTASEYNNHFFTIERSEIGHQFEIISTVPSQNSWSSTEQFYSYIDNNPHKGTSYYRLKQTDFDGTYEYSKVITYTHRETNNRYSIRLTHGASQNTTMIWHPIPPDEIHTLILFSTHGKRIVSSKPVQEIVIPHLDSGNYLIRILTTSNTFYNSMIVVK